MASNGEGAADNWASQWSMRDLLTTVFKRRILIVTFAVAVLTLVVCVNLMLPRVYEVKSILLVKKARADVPIAPSDSRQLVIDDLNEQDLNTEIQILKSRMLIEEVLETMGVDDTWRPRSATANVIRGLKRALGAPHLSYLEEMVVHLDRELDVYPIRRSNVIRISYRSQKPEWATQIVAMLTDRYLEQRARMFLSPQAVSFFEDQMIEAKGQLDGLERDLEAYLDDAGITMVQAPEGADSLAAQKAIVMERLARFQNDLGDAESLFEEQTNKMHDLRDRLETEPERYLSSNQQNQDPTVLELERALARLELERDALLLEYKAGSRRVHDIDVQIGLVRTRLDVAQQRVGTINRTEINPIHQQLRADYLQLEIGLTGTTARIESLREQGIRPQRQLDVLNEKGFEIERLWREVKASESNYLLYRKKHEEARISAAMDQQKIINVSVAQPARRPLEPLPRGLITKVSLALLIGIMGGLGLAFGVENYLDHSFTTGEDIELHLGIPHIASISNRAPGA